MSYGSSGGDMVVGLRLDDQLSPALSMAANNVIAFTGSVERSLNALSRLGVAAAPIAALGIGLKAGVGAAADLQQQIANLNAVLSATPAQMQRITASSLELSRQTQFTAAQIIQAQAQLAKAGANPSNITGTAKNVLDLASATFSDPKSAANAYIAAQKDFQLSNAQSKDTVNLLAQAVDSSTGNLNDFQTAFRQLGPVAGANNLSLKDTTTAIADLMNAGLKGDAGTALKTFLQRIVTETPQARAEIQKLGLDFFTAGGQLKPISDIFDQIRLKTAGLSDEEAQQSLGKIFGTRGIRVADIAMQEGSAGLAETAQHMADIGNASDIAAKKLGTFQGQAHILASSLNVLAVQGGNAVLPMLTGMTQGVTEFANKLSGLNGIAGGIIPQAAIGAAALFGASKLGAGVQARFTAPEAARQAALGEFQAQEEIRLQQHNIKLEALEAEHQVRMAAIQDASQAKMSALRTSLASDPSALRQAAVAEQQAMASAMAKQESSLAAQVESNAFVRGKPPAGLASAKSASLGASIGAMIGEVAVPITLALIAKDLIIDPLIGQITQKLAGDTFKNLSGDIGYRSDLATGDGNSPLDFYKQQLAKTQADHARAQDEIYQHERAKHANDGVFVNTDYPDQKMTFGNNAVSDEQYKQAKQTAADAARAEQQMQAKIAALPDQAYNEQVTRLQGISSGVGSGKYSVDQALANFSNIVTDGGTRDAQVESLTTHLLAMGVPMEKINDLIQSARPLLEQQAQAYYDMADATDAASKKSADRASLLRSLGVSEQDIRLDQQGGKDNLAIHQRNNAAIKDDAKDATELKKSLDQAAQGYDALVKSVGKLNPEKGIPDLLKNLDALKAAQADLTVNGQSSKSLDELVQIGSEFQKLTDEENKARAGYDAFLLGISHTQSYNKEIDSFKQELVRLDEYLANKPASAKTADDTKYLENKKVLLAELNNQQDKLFESEVQQVNALAASGKLPDFAEMNAKWNATMQAFGGGPVVQLKLQMDATDALRSSKNVETVMGALTRDPHHIRMLLENFPEVQAKIDAMGGDISKLSAHDWQVILETTVGDKSGLDALDAYNRAQGAHYQAEVSIVYKETNPQLNPATTSDYHDVAHHVDSLSSGAVDRLQQAQEVKFTATMDDSIVKGQIDNLSQTPVALQVTANVSAAQSAIDALKGQTISVGVNYGSGGPPSVPSPGGTGGDNFAYGGHTNGRYAIVGDGKDGNMRYAEVVDFSTGSVIDHDTAVRAGLFGGHLPKYAGGTDTIDIGGTDGPYSADNPGPVGDLSKKITGHRAGGGGGGLKRARADANALKHSMVDANEALGLFSSSLDGLSSKEIASVATNFDKLYATLKSYGQNQLPKNATQGQKDAADQSALNQSLAAATAWAQAMYDIDHNAANVKADLQAIVETGGPIGQNMAAQVTIMSQMAQVQSTITAEQKEYKENQREHDATLRQRRNADQQTQRDRRTYQIQEQQWSINAQRNQTLADWRLQDNRQKDQDGHQRKLDGIQAESDAENDAWTIKQRNFQDESRALTQRGTLAQRQVEDQQTALERAHRDYLGRNNANQQLLAAQSMAATSSGSSNLAGLQLAISKYNDKLSQQDYQKQLDTIQDTIKLQARVASDAKFDLETQQLAATRAHENEMTRISEASKAENQRWQGVQSNYQSQDKAITRTRTLEQWAEADRQRNEQLVYAAIDQDIADRRQKEDDAFTDGQQKLQDDISANQEILKGLGADLTALKDIETVWEKLYPIVGNAANVLLNMGQSIIDTAGQNVTSDGGGKVTHTTRKLANALGTDYFVGGRTSLGEHGVEAVLAPGSTVLSNASIRALVNSLANPLPPISGGGGGNTFHFNLKGTHAPDEQAQAKIEAFVVAQIAESEARAARRQGSRPTGTMRG